MSSEEKAAVIIQRWWRGFERCEYEPIVGAWQWGPVCNRLTKFRNVQYNFVVRCPEHTCPCPEEDWDFCGICHQAGCGHPLHENEWCQCDIS